MLFGVKENTKNVLPLLNDHWIFVCAAYQFSVHSRLCSTHHAIQLKFRVQGQSIYFIQIARTVNRLIQKKNVHYNYYFVLITIIVVLQRNKLSIIFAYRVMVLRPKCMLYFVAARVKIMI